ncbi:MAG TPA: cyclic nucleotide-binding domain-containing protein, partial [Vicinamibacteria bacterium]|nr:cyclic nucleotide-binding domain-containing protein [Vicinamibacteria bacterium]
MSQPADTAFLRASDLFEHQGEEVVRAVLVQGRIEAFGAGEVVFRQGDAGDRLYIVKSGVLEVLASRDGSD